MLEALLNRVRSGWSDYNPLQLFGISDPEPEPNEVEGTAGINREASSDTFERVDAASSESADAVGISTQGISSSSESLSASPTPGKPNNQWHLKAARQAWTATYWPYADFSGDGVGNPARHLWAEGGCLDKLDELRVKRGKQSGARAHELVPALNFLRNDGTPSGYYIPSGLIRESDAERTTGVDFTNSGSLDKDVEVDILDDHRQFGQNGRTNGVLSVGWWGSCDQVALAGILFDAPKRDVSVDGVTFTVNDIKGLLTLIVNGQSKSTEYCGWKFWDRPDKITLKDGTVLEGRAVNVSMSDCLKGRFSRERGNRLIVRELGIDKEIEFKTYKKTTMIDPATVKCFEREDEAEPSASDFHIHTKKWLRDKRPFAMDRDSGSHLWNIGVDEAKITKTRVLDPDLDVDKLVGFNGPYTGKDLCVYMANLYLNNELVESYEYWIEKVDGEHINSGWTATNPAFLWRPTNDELVFEGNNARNPFVEPEMVKEIYDLSIA